MASRRSLRSRKPSEVDATPTTEVTNAESPDDDSDAYVQSLDDDNEEDVQQVDVESDDGILTVGKTTRKPTHKPARTPARTPARRPTNKRATQKYKGLTATDAQRQ